MINQRFGKWLVLSERLETDRKYETYICRCDCGLEKKVLGFTLRNGRSTQCKECHRKAKHGMSKTNIYKIWAGLYTRCYNQNSHTYKYYGGRGIKICERWRDFKLFFEDMGERPDNLQLDRIDPDKDYCKENCRWISKSENSSRARTRAIDITSQKFGKWTVLHRNINPPNRNHVYYICRCDCGYESSLIGSMVRTGKTNGCMNCKNIAHRGWYKRYERSNCQLG